MSDDHLLSSGEFSRRSRLSPKALRLYEQQGLLVPDEVDAANHYRRYRAERLADARLIVWLRRLDMPLADVARVLATPAAERAGLVTAYWDAAEAKFAAQRYLAAHVRDLVSGNEGGYGMTATVHTREIPAQLVLTEQRHIAPEELPDWIRAALGRLLAAAGPVGGPSAAAFVVYHGEVNHDSDGPVEVCLPIDPAAADKVDAPTREEPAHREAYVRITKAQVAFPQILSAFDTVGRWLTEHELPASGAPREVYFTDFMRRWTRGRGLRRRVSDLTCHAAAVAPLRARVGALGARWGGPGAHWSGTKEVETMAEMQTWQKMRDQIQRQLERQTGEGVEPWNRKIKAAAPADESALRDWLGAAGPYRLPADAAGVGDLRLPGLSSGLGGRPRRRPICRPPESAPDLRRGDRRGQCAGRGRSPGAQDLRIAGHFASHLRHRASEHEEASRRRPPPR